ncbi:PqqD family protein [Sphingomonas hankyongi]|uniref:PqqD family protein n=1 Tax=Sphingomonas hankyongi TaxID=2908209 RepID=A0ABT0S2P8_9SPHN|nr:PqqD family protein [Sphingomonas hankyongi]MCL6730140.1 PqqD family protein [Sphingomonas hankyongi]
MMDILSQRLTPSPDAFATAMGSETVLLQVKSGIYYGLDEVGTRIWTGLQAGLKPSEICEKIAGEFDIPVATIEADARAFLEELKAHEIIIAE